MKKGNGMKRNKWLAGILNLIFPGTAYLYLGERKVFGALLTLGTFVSYIAYYSNQELAHQINQNGDALLWLGVLIYTTAFVVDAVQLAKRI